MKVLTKKSLLCFFMCLCFEVISTSAMTQNPNVLYEQGMINVKEGNLNLAKQKFINYLSYVKDLSDNEYYYGSQALAYCYYKLNKPDSAIYYNEDFFFFPVDPKTVAYADSLQFEGINYIYNQEFNKAKRDLSECIKVQLQVLGEKHLLTAKSKDWLSYVYVLENNYNEAIKEKCEAFETYKLFYEPSSPIIITTAVSLGDFYDHIGQYEEAYNVLSPILQNLKVKDSEFFNIRNRLSRYLSISGNYKDAIEFEIENIKLAGSNSQIVIKSLCNLCEYYVSLGKINKAFETIKEAIELCTIDSLSSELAMALNVKANLYSITGDQINAINTGKEVLKMRKKLYDHHSDIAMSYNNLARYYSFLSLFTDALRLQEFCIKEYENIGYSHTTEMVAAYNNYSDYFANQGNLDKAVEYQLLSIEILKNLYDKIHPDYAIALNNLAKLYYLQKEYEKAIKTELEVIDIRNQLFHGCHTDIASAYSNLATISLANEDYESAIHYNQKSLDMFKLALGDAENADYIRGLSQMSEIYTAMNEFDKAIEIILPTGDYYIKQFGENSPAYIDYLQSMAILYYRTGQHDLATKCILNVEKVIENYTLDTFSCLTANERSQFWERNKNWYLNYLPYLSYGINNDSVLETLYNSLLTSKGILLGTEIEIEKIIKSSGNETLISQWDTLRNMKGQLSFEYNGALTTEREKIEILLEQVKDLEQKIMSEIKNYGDFSIKFRISWTEIKSILNKDEVAIEFCIIPTMTEEKRYVALIITPSSACPILIDLFSESEMPWPSNKNISGDLEKFYDLVWRPILNKLNPETSKLYFSPAGKLLNSPIEYAERGDIPLYDSIKFYRLSSTREIIDLKKQTQELSKAVVYGGLKYEPYEEEYVNENIESEIINEGFLARNNFDYLPGTLQEIEKITELLDYSNIEFIRYSGLEGTEETFYDLNGTDASVIHLATHGFYYNTKNDNQWISRIMSEYPPQLLTEEDASLCRTGVLLSNAKVGLVSKIGVNNKNDGILTAKEISHINLNGLPLTVLSACKTGQGDVEDDGVFGLQRGFKKAGAQALLMSLWNVSDEATLLLMEYFYKYILSHMSYHDALTAAQNELRNYKNGRFNYPKYWAAFILLDSI